MFSSSSTPRRWVLAMAITPPKLASLVCTRSAVALQEAVSDLSTKGTFIYSVFYALISLPAVVITYRSVITPYRLPAFHPALALRILLTPTERRRPWVIYLTPGLLASQISHVGYVVVILSLVRRLLLPEMPIPGSMPDDISIWRIVTYCVSICSGL
jgi:hypothetical protein